MTGSRIQRFAITGVVALGLLQGCEAKRSSVLDPYGAPIYNFRVAAAGKDMPRGTVTIAEPFNAAHSATVDTTVTITMAGLDSLTAGVYQVWIGDAATTNPKYYPAKGTLTVTRKDTADDGSVQTKTTTAAGVSSFSTGGSDASMKLVVNSASYGSKLPTDKLVLVSIESGAGATTPSDARPLFAKKSSLTGSVVFDTVAGVIDTTTAVASGSLKFGHYDPAGSYIYSPIGRGTAGVRGTTLVVDDSALMRPPVGYYYAAFLIKLDSVGRVGQAVSLGPQTAPYPFRSQSLKDADITVISPWVTANPPEVVAAASRISADSATVLMSSAGAFSGWSLLRITLQTKLGAGTQAPPIVLSAPIPCDVAGGC